MVKATDSLHSIDLLPIVDLAPAAKVTTPLPAMPDYPSAGPTIAVAKRGRKAARKAKGGANARR